MSPPSMPPAAVPARRRRRWPRAVGEWLLSFAPIFLVSVIPGGIAVDVAGDSSFGARLAGMVIGLAVLVAAGMLWWLVTRSRSRLSLDMFVLWVAERLAFKRLGTAGRPTLACLMAFGIAAMVFAVVQQPQLGTDGNVQHPAYAVVFFALVVLVTAGRLKRRV